MITRAQAHGRAAIPSVARGRAEDAQDRIQDLMDAPSYRRTPPLMSREARRAMLFAPPTRGVLATSTFAGKTANGGTGHWDTCYDPQRGKAAGRRARRLHERDI